MGAGTERRREIRTLPPELVAVHLGWLRAARDAFSTLIVAFTVAGAAGLLGVHEGSATASAGGYDVQLDYPQITRGGLDADLQLRVARAGGFGSTPVTIAWTEDYVTLFNIQRVFPQPVRETSEQSVLYWTFEPPAGDVLNVSVPAQTAASLTSVGDHHAELVVLSGNTVVARMPLRTVVVP